jgi:hypothetical protein
MVCETWAVLERKWSIGLHHFGKPRAVQFMRFGAVISGAIEQDIGISTVEHAAYNMLEMISGAINLISRCEFRFQD